MGILGEFERSFGPDALKPTTGVGTVQTNWQSLCVCGHLQKHHSPDVGGLFAMQPDESRTMPDGREFSFHQVFTGCRGAMVNRGVETMHDETAETEETVTRVETFDATCPCPEFREVAKVDRPNRYFNQRIPVRFDDPLRHPMSVGVRALATFLSRRRRALSDPAWASAEFDRRFEWTHRVCALSQCEATDDVWAVFINDDGDSEMRCAQHR